MGIEREILSPNHHAYLFFGTLPEQIRTTTTEGRMVLRYDHPLGVEEVRLLQEFALQSVTTGKRVLVCTAPGSSLQAQNALLKLIEDMQAGVYCFLCFPPGTAVAATLRSRCALLEEEVQTQYSEEFATFLQQSPAKRLAFLDEIWAIGEGKRHARITQLAQDAECYLREGIRTESDQKTLHRRRRLTRQLREALQHGALHKMTLQLLAFL